jgi:dCTP diphosphatase
MNKRPEKPESLEKGDPEVTVGDLKTRMIRFVQERNWEPYHSPKNLAISISLEANELLEHFQWILPKSEDLTEKEKHDVGEEMADVLAYLLSLSNVLQIDLAKAFVKKMAKNEKKYPVDRFRGIWKKPESPV